MASSSEGNVHIEQLAPGSFALTVVFDGQRFACGSYLSRAEAERAGRLFLARKEGEAAHGRHRGKGRKKG
ncbi:MAG: hypothetical protein ABT940_03705 [Alphaproteobacteria bacterium]